MKIIKWCNCLDCTCNPCHCDDTCDCTKGWVCTCKNCECKDKNATSCTCCDKWCTCGDCKSCTAK